MSLRRMSFLIAIVLTMVIVLTILLVVAFVGTINPSGGSTSIFVPLEHTVLTGAVAPAQRTHAFAR